MQYLTSSEQRVFDMTMQPILCTNEINVLLDTLLHKYTRVMYSLRGFLHSGTLLNKLQLKLKAAASE